MPTKAGLPGWFPEDFKTDPALQAAFEDTAGWHAAGPGRKPGKAAVKAKLRAAHLKNRAAAERSSEHAATWDDVALVIELAAEAWRAELRGPDGKWTAAGLAELRKLNPAEKKAYLKSGALPDRFKSAAAEKAHDTASATASRDAKAKIAASKAKASTTAARPVPKTRPELEQHMADMHGGNPVVGRRAGPKKMTAAQVRARHAEMHAKGQLGVAHTHGEPPSPSAPGKPLPGGNPPKMTDLDPPFSNFMFNGPQQGSLMDYATQEGARVINGSLRDGKMPPGDRAAEVKAIDQTIQMFKIPKASTVYRGMATPPGMKLTPGSVFSDKGYSSVSNDKAQARDFAFARSTGKQADGKTVEGIVKYPGKPVLMSINLPGGQHVVPGAPNLGEFLLPRGSQFRVDSVSADGSEVSVSIIPAP